MTLLAAFQVLLHRYSGQEDFAIGSPIAGRTRAELEGLVGLLRQHACHARRPFGRAPDSAIASPGQTDGDRGVHHQDLPFERVVSIAHPNRDKSRSPLFQVMFVLQNAPTVSPASTDLSLSPLALESETSKFDLTLFAAEVAEGLRLTMEYSTDLYDAATVDRMLSHYEASPRRHRCPSRSADP